MKTRFILILISLCYSLLGISDNEKDSYLFSKVDHQQGLSNRAVLCLFQDNTGLMWLGTYDGVNCYDGKGMEVFRSDFSSNHTLNNNVIHSIQQADNSCLWINTSLGISRFSQSSRQIIGNYDLNDYFYLHSNRKGNTWVVGEKGISYYNTFHKRFIKIKTPPVPVDEMDRRAFVTDEGALWVFTHRTGQIQQFSLNAFDADSLSTRLSVSVNNLHSKPIEDIFSQNGICCFIDKDKDLYMYDISRKSKIYIRNIGALLQKYGSVNSIVPFYEDIIVAFRTNGLIRLRTSCKYEEEMVNPNVRIFAIYNDPRQGILWVGSDGQGAIMYSKKHSIATNLMLSSLSPNLSRQVRSVMTDKYGGLWFGTKGDGLLHISSYRNGMGADKTEVYSAADCQHALAYTKRNTEFQVYALKESRYMDGFWVGTGATGLFYYSFTDRKLHLLSDSPEVAQGVHSIYEANDSVLYAATSGAGLIKFVLDKQGDTYRVKSQKRFHFFYEQQDISLFYGMVAQGDSLLWLGSRQKGLIRFNLKTEEYQVISLNERLHKSVDDILCLHLRRNGDLYVGTSSGLVCITFQGEKMTPTYIGREQGLLNDMIHGILEDDNGLLWLGTNRGLIKFNPDNHFSHAFYYSGGVQIGEFSDDAYYRCPYTGRLFFGGVDGLLYLEKKGAVISKDYPDILLRKLMISRKMVNPDDYYTPDGIGLRFEGSDLTFSLTFVVPDFISNADVEYSCILEGYDKDWGTFSSVNEASFTDIPPGDYVFKVRYKKDVFDTEYKVYSIPIYILPPWYRTIVAYIIYILLFLAFAGYLFYLLRKYFLHERVIKRLLATEARKDLSGGGYYDRDLLNRFTIIYNACDQLRAENISYEHRCASVDLIRETAMTALFHPGMLHSDKLKQFYPTTFTLSGRMCIQELSLEVLRALTDQGMNIATVQSVIPANFTFPVYKNALRCILYHCYACIGGSSDTTEVTVDAQVAEEMMQLTFSTDGGMAKDLFAQLSGTVNPVSGTKDVDDTFKVQLLLNFVRSALEQLHAVVNYTVSEGGSNRLTITFKPAVLADEGTKEKKKVLLLEDREEMVWLITGLLSEDYTVHVVKSIQLAFEEMRKSPPAAFLVDMLIYTTAESTFMEYVNKERSLLSKTAFIPMLTWKVSSSLQREMILWSDSYVVLPYDILFLREVVNKSIYGKREAKQIYMEDLGDLAGQIVCTTSEQADFIRKLLQVIEQNLDQEELGSTLIADRMSMSPRQFYRKFKEISNVAPTDLIKSYRMEKAARLLLDEQNSIQDVISDVGISSRSYFYKEFARRFGMTPKDYREKGKGE